jgi:hypothetical protein
MDRKVIILMRGVEVPYRPTGWAPHHLLLLQTLTKLSDLLKMAGNRPRNKCAPLEPTRLCSAVRAAGQQFQASNPLAIFSTVPSVRSVWLLDFLTKVGVVCSLDCRLSGTEFTEVSQLQLSMQARVRTRCLLVLTEKLQHK